MQQRSEDEVPQALKRVVSRPCSNCGGQLQFDAGTVQLLCPYCGSNERLPAENDLVVERSFSEALHLEGLETGLETAGRKALHCRSCGAHSNVPADQLTLECAFCGSKTVNEEAHDTRRIKPQGVLPFRITEAQATASFRNWIGRGWFHPGALKKKVKHLQEMRSVYVPYWTYDAHTRSTWTADAGYYYYVPVQYTDSQGRQQTRMEQRIRWVPASGYYENFFNDVLVIASQGVPQSRSMKVEPFPLNEVVNYSPDYLLGTSAEVYQRNVQQGFEVADGIMDAAIREACIRQIPGDTFRDLVVNTQKDGITFKHLLLPLYIAAYRYNNKSWQVVVNGSTGAISGEKPLSWLRILLAVLVGVAVAALSWWLYQRAQGKA